ncbi:MAG: ATP-binding cassette domain-containing protein [Bacillota bacterium]
MTVIIKAENIVVARNNKEILRVDSIALRRREILSVIGPNGAGKSTLLTVLALLTPPVSGDIKFFGERVTGKNALACRRRMAVVFQEPLLLNTNVFNNVAQGLKFRGVPSGKIRSEVEMWLEKMGVAHLADRSARFLSGGEAQRVSLARALVLQPEVLFMDEPFMALDFSTRNGLIRDLAGIIREKGITTFFVTHNYSELQFFMGNTVVMSGGRIVYRGETEKLFNGEMNDPGVMKYIMPEGCEMGGVLPPGLI